MIKTQLTLTAMTQGGEAMGRDETGRVVFVPYAIAGEEIVAEIVQEKKGYARARLVEILRPSPARVAPRCPHFGPASPLTPHPHPPPPSPDRMWGRQSSGGPLHQGTPPHSTHERGEGAPGVESEAALPPPGEGVPEAGVGGEAVRGCGGCQWQHIAYEAQLRFKADIVREQFARLGKFPDAPVRETLGMPDPWRYRNHVQFHLDEDGHLCFRALESHDLVPISECHIQHPSVYEMFLSTELEGADYPTVTLRAGTRTGQKMLILEGRDEEAPEIAVDEPVSIVYVTPDGDTVVLIGRDAIHEELRGSSFRISPDSFFQVNTAMADKLVDLVESYLAPAPSDTLLDAYGGVGTFGLLLASRVAKVLHVESGPSAVEDARANAVELANVEIHPGPVEEVLPRLKGHVDIAVADPPRAGMDRRAVDALIALQPRAFVYVSCDPATLARDARRLVDGGYTLVEVQPVDMFPQTYHVETVCRFERA